MKEKIMFHVAGDGDSESANLTAELTFIVNDR